MARRIMSQREQFGWMRTANTGPGPLTPTGEVMDGVSAPQVYTDSEGSRWLGKTAPRDFLPKIEYAAGQIQSRAGLPAAEMHLIDFDGKPGLAQRMFDADPAFPDHRVDLASMDPSDVLELQKHMALDWMISNHDAHSGNFLRDRATGGIVGIDKGQAFKYFGDDSLTHRFGEDVNPPLHPNVPVYSSMWRQFMNGQGELADPRTGELGEFINALSSIPDDEYIDYLRPYADGVGAAGRAPLGDPEAFLDAAVERKNNLAAELGDLYDRALARRTRTAAILRDARAVLRYARSIGL